MPIKRQHSILFVQLLSTLIITIYPTIYASGKVNAYPWIRWRLYRQWTTQGNLRELKELTDSQQSTNPNAQKPYFRLEVNPNHKIWNDFYVEKVCLPKLYWLLSSLKPLPQELKQQKEIVKTHEQLTKCIEHLIDYYKSHGHEKKNLTQHELYYRKYLERLKLYDKKYLFFPL